MFGLTPVRSISTAELAQQLQQPHVQLLDVREPSKYRAGHILRAKNEPLRRVADYNPPANTKLYVICRSGARSKQAYKLLHKRGLNVTNVAGGMLAWEGRKV